MNKKILTVSIVVADYYKEITDSLTNAAVEHLQNNKTNYEIFKVPGVYEIPQFINWKLSKKKINLFIALGCVIKGDTYHFEVISDAVGFPMADVEAIIGNGKLTTEVAKNDIKDGTLYMYTLEDTARFCGVAPGSPPFGQKNGQMVDHWNLTQKWWVNFGFMTDVADPAKGLDCALVKEAL